MVLFCPALVTYLLIDHLSQVSLLCLPCHDDGPVLEPASHALKSLKSWAQLDILLLIVSVTCFDPTVEKPTNTENWYQQWVSSMTVPDWI